MKKTIHINLAGLVFKIEEDAYTRLNDYLEAVKARLGGGDEAKEIIDDITLRIAEIFKGANNEPGTAITMAHVEEVIKTLGAPDDYELNDDEEAPSPHHSEWQPPLRKHLFRDTDHRILAGVCAGLGNYFNIDPIVFRLLFIVGLIYGISIIPYIILWIAVPKAITVQQRLMMKGGEQRPESLPKRLFRDMDNRIIGGVGAGLGNFFNIDPLIFRLLFIVGLYNGYSIILYILLWVLVPKAVTPQERLMMMGGDQERLLQHKESGRNLATKKAVRGVAIAGGIVLMVVTFLALMATTMTLSISDLIFGSLISDGAWIPELPELLLTQDQTNVGLLGIGLLTGIPLLILFYLGMHLVFQFKRISTPLLLSGLGLWLAGLGLIAYTSVNTLRSFTSTYTNTETQTLPVPAANTLYIEPNQASLLLNRGQNILHAGDLTVRLQEGELTAQGKPSLRIIEGGDDFKISIEKKARGRNMDDAAQNASMIEFFYLQNDSVLLLDRYFTLQDRAMLRLQKVVVRLEVPKGKEILVAPELKSLLD